MTKLLEIWRNLEPRGQIGIVGAGIAVLVTMFLLFTFSSRPSYVTLESNLNPGDAGTASKALAGAGVSYKLADGGTSIRVKEGDASQARVALAEKNLLGDGHVGLEIFDKTKLGATDIQNKVNYQRGLEGEMARMIEQIDGVTKAEVQLVLPEETLFSDQSSHASASVLLTATQLDPTAVAGIAHLVSSGVKGLDAQDVTITDETGTLLWPTGSAGGPSSNVKLQAEQAYSSQLGAQINALLASTLGTGKAQARVHADLNVDQTTIDRVTYAKKGTPLQTESANETLRNKGAGAGSTPPPSGSASNIPSYGAASASGGNSSSNYSNKTGSTVFGVDKTVEHTDVTPGQVHRLDVALLVDKSVPAAQVASLKAAVGSLAGIDPKRGDTLAVSTVAFAQQPTPNAPAASAGPLANPLGLAKYVLIGLGALLFLFFMRRSLRRREGEDLGVKPTWLREIEATVPLAELEAAPNRALDAGREQYSVQQAQLEEIVKTQPARVAAQVGQWMRE